MAFKIQIVGAGLAGLALADELIENGLTVEIIEKSYIGAGASGIAAGLVHPYLGQSGKRALFADDALSYLRLKLQTLQSDLDRSFFQEIEIQKHFSSSNEKQEFCSKMAEHGDFREHDDTSVIINGFFVDTKRYLLHLANRLKEKGVTFLYEEKSLEESSPYPVVFCVGAALAKCSSICFPSKIRKGQVLIAKRDPRVERSFTATGYVALDPFADHMILGSSYEREFPHELPDEKRAHEWINPRLSPYLPAWDELTFLECRSGMRISPAVGYLPVCEKKGENVWVFGGFGSRGLLYHTVFAKKAAESILEELSIAHQRKG